MYEGNENQPTYRLEGETLEIARELHEYSLQANQEYRQIARQIAEFSDSLMVVFDEKHNDKFQDIFQRLADRLGITVHEMRKFHLDATYIDDHNIAFMKQGPIQDNVMVMDTHAGEDQLEMFDEEDGVQ